MSKKLMFVVNTDEFFLSHRLPIALKALQDGYEVYVASKQTGFGDVICAHGLVHLPLDLNRSSMSIRSNIRTFFQLTRLFHQVKPDIVHLVTIKPVLLGGLAARIALRRAVVVAISGMGFIFIAQGLKAKIRRFIAVNLYKLALTHQSMKVIFQNNDDLRTLGQICPMHSSTIKLIPGSGVDIAEYRQTPVPDGVLVVMMAARLLIDKGLREFVGAAKLLKSNYPHIRFVLVGDTDPGNPTTIPDTELQQWINEQTIEHWGSRKDMPHVFSLSSIVVLPSYREGFPKVLIEAAACGRPVITTDVPGCRDAIEPNVTGLLVPARDAAALADAIEILLKDAELRQSMGEAGRKLAEREFGIDKVVDAHLQIYRELLDACVS